MNIEAPRRQLSLGEKPVGIATCTVLPQLPASGRVHRRLRSVWTGGRVLTMMELGFEF